MRIPPCSRLQSRTELPRPSSATPIREPKVHSRETNGWGAKPRSGSSILLFQLWEIYSAVTLSFASVLVWSFCMKQLRYPGTFRHQTRAVTEIPQIPHKKKIHDKNVVSAAFDSQQTLVRTALSRPVPHPEKIF